MIDYNQIPTVCSVTYRDEIRALYNLDTEGQMSLYNAMAHHPMRDKDTGYPYMPITVARKLLHNTDLTVLQVASMPYVDDAQMGSYQSGKATVYAIAYNPCIEAEMTRDLDTVGAVDFVTGRPVTERSAKTERKKQMEMMDELDYSTHPASLIFEMMHDPRRQKWLKKQGRLTADIVDFHTLEIPDSTVINKKTGISRQDNTERMMAYHVKNYMKYNLDRLKPVDNTSRIYSDGLGPMMFPKGIRNEYFAGPNNYNMDLSSAQVRIIAAKWGIKELLNIEHWWEHLAELLGIEDLTDEIKKRLKTFTYLVIFGGGKELAQAKLDDPDLVAALYALKIIKTILRARKREQKRIINAKGPDGYGGSYDAFDQWCSLNADSLADKKPLERVLSLCARIVQSYEVAIMLAGYKAIYADPDLLAVLHLHDGVYVTCTHNQYLVLPKLEVVKAAMIAEAARLGIEMEVDIKQLVSKPSAAYIAHQKAEATRLAKLDKDYIAAFRAKAA